MLNLLQNYLQQYCSKDITLEELLSEDYSRFNQQEQATIKQYLKTLLSSFKPYSLFFKRHNMTEKKLLEMSQDEFAR